MIVYCSQSSGSPVFELLSAPDFVYAVSSLLLVCAEQGSFHCLCGRALLLPPEDAFTHEAAWHVTPKKHRFLPNLGFNSLSHLSPPQRGWMKHSPKRWEGPQQVRIRSQPVPRQHWNAADQALRSLPPQQSHPRLHRRQPTLLTCSPALLWERQVTAVKISGNEKSKNDKLADLNILHPNLGLFFSGGTEITATFLFFSCSFLCSTVYRMHT